MALALNHVGTAVAGEATAVLAVAGATLAAAGTAIAASASVHAPATRRSTRLADVVIMIPSTAAGCRLPAAPCLMPGDPDRPGRWTTTITSAMTPVYPRWLGLDPWPAPKCGGRVPRWPHRRVPRSLRGDRRGRAGSSRCRPLATRGVLNPEVSVSVEGLSRVRAPSAACAPGLS